MVQIYDKFVGKYFTHGAYGLDPLPKHPRLSRQMTIIPPQQKSGLVWKNSLTFHHHLKEFLGIPVKFAQDFWERYSPDNYIMRMIQWPIPLGETWHWGRGPLKFSCHITNDGTWIVLGPFRCCICQPLFHGRRNLPHNSHENLISLLGAKNNNM